MQDHVIPVSYRISSGLSQVTEKIGKDKEAGKVAEVTFISGTLKKSGVSSKERGIVEAVASSFSTSRDKAKRIIQKSEEGKTIRQIVERIGKDISMTEWPEKIKTFCLTKPICREAPGETVSVAYGQ